MFLLGPLSVAQARVALVATGTPELVLLDVSSDTVVARMPLPGPSGAVAVNGDGTRGYVAAGAAIVALDVNERTEVSRAVHGSEPVWGLAVSPDGRRLYAVQGERLRVLRATTLELLGSVPLRGRGNAMALGSNGRLAAVVLDRGRVAIVDTRARTLQRRVRVPGATGVAITADGRTLVPRAAGCAPSRAARRARASGASRLPAGAGGNLALSPGRSRLAVGARPGGSSGALVVLRGGRVRRLAAGAGLGTPAWTPDANRLFFANAAAARSRSSAPSRATCSTPYRSKVRRRRASSYSPGSR